MGVAPRQAAATHHKVVEEEIRAVPAVLVLEEALLSTLLRGAAAAEDRMRGDLVVVGEEANVAVEVDEGGATKNQRLQFTSKIPLFSDVIHTTNPQQATR